MSRPQQYLARVNRKKKEKFQSKKAEFEERTTEKAIIEEKLARGEEVTEKRRVVHHSQVKSLRFHRKHPRKFTRPENKKEGEKRSSGSEEETGSEEEEESDEESQEETTASVPAVNAPIEQKNPPRENPSGTEESEEEEEIFDAAPFRAHAAKLAEEEKKSQAALQNSAAAAPVADFDDSSRQFADSLFSGTAPPAESLSNSLDHGVKLNDFKALDVLLGVSSQDFLGSAIPTLKQKTFKENPLAALLDNTKQTGKSKNSQAEGLSEDLEATLDALIGL